MNGDVAVVKDERKMIPVSPDTHRRVMAYAGRLAAEWGARTSMDAAIIHILDIVDGDRPAGQETEFSAAEVPSA